MQDVKSRVEGGNTAWRAMVSFFRSPVFMLLGLAVISELMFFTSLNSYPMQNWDEGIHAQVTKEMVETGDPWTLHYQGDFYFRKPPLKMWLTAPLLSAFGDHNWVYRFWSALAGVLSVMLLSWFAYKKDGRLSVGWLVGAIFASGQFIYYHSFRTGEMDGLLLLFLIAGIYAYWKSAQHSRWLIIMGLSFGLAVMSKSMAGLVGPIIVFADILIRKKWKLFTERNVWYGVGAFLVITVPWHISMVSLYGGQFWDEYIGFHVVDRTFTQLYADLPSYWYVKILYGRLFPLSLFLFGGLFVGARKLLRDRDKSQVLLFAWLFVPLLLYSWVKTKFEWYMLPAYPAAAWLVAQYLSSLVTKYKDWLFQATAVVSGVLLFAMIPGAIPPGAKTYWFALQAYLPDIVEQKIQNPYLLSVLFVLLIVLMLVWLEKRNRMLVRIVLVLCVLYPVGFAFGRTAGMIATQPTRSVYEEMSEVVASSEAQEVVLFETDIMDKPAGYFELYRATGNIRTAQNIKDAFAAEGSIVVTSKEISEKQPLLTTDLYYLYE